MAQAAEIIEQDDIPLIEEQVDTGLAALLAGYQSKYTPGGTTPDQLDEHYSIDPSQPIPELSNNYAEAFVARDSSSPTRQLYATVCSQDLPARMKDISTSIGLVTADMVVPIAAGTVKCSHLNESRLVIFYDRPIGQQLSDILTRGTRFHESRVIPLILDPICNALMALRDRKLSHGNIHAGNFWMSDTPTLGECFSAPAGTLSEYLYRPVDRIQCDTLGQGEANEKTDIYAIGVLVYEAMYGLDRLRALSREDYIERVLRQGVYNVFTAQGDFADSFQDFFRGTLNDSVSERWGMEQLAQFIGGKRFNMIAPAVAKDASRPFVLGQQNFFSRSLLTHTLHRNWRDTVRDIRILKLERWCETGLHRPELGERIERALRGGANAQERHVNDMMMRIFAVLDPAGPIRSKSVSARPDGIPMMLAAYAQDKGPERAQLLAMIASDISSYWMEQAEINKTQEVTQAIWRLKRAKPYFENRALGFGFERALYETNPTLSCQSPLLKQYHITTVEEALRCLDAMARNLAPETSLIDRHLAAFIASKLDISKPIELDDIVTIPTLAQNQELIMLRLLARAQHKHPNLKLVGLAAWSGMRIEKLIDEIHNRVIRKRQKLMLKKLASSGSLRDVLSAIVNRDVIARDTDGFAHALALYDINTKRMEFLGNPLITEYKARKIGGKTAVIISYTVLTVMSYITLTHLLGI